MIPSGGSPPNGISRPWMEKPRAGAGLFAFVAGFGPAQHGSSREA